MSDQPGMSHDELIASLRADMAATAAELAEARRNGEVQKIGWGQAAAAHHETEAELARLEEASKAASQPDAQIRAGILALAKKWRDRLGI